MDFDERKRIVAKFNEWELRYPVEDWMVNGVHLWPIVKINLFLQIFTQKNKNKKKANEDGYIKRKIGNIAKLIKAFFQVATFTREHKKILFCSATTYRANVTPDQHKLHFSRYFDPIMDQLSEQGIPSLLLEYYPLSTDQLYKRERIIPLLDLLPYFDFKASLAKRPRYSADHDLRFNKLLDEISSEVGLPRGSLLKKINSVVSSILRWKSLFEFVFERTRPKHCIGVCYYSPSMYGMILAAKKSNTITVDMQHGGQGNLHLAYTFAKTPAKGYNCLPTVFWCWDNESYQHLASQAFNGHHLVFLGGNPWLDYLKKLHIKFPKLGSKPIMLYTLQPLKPVVDIYLLETISKTAAQYDWWLRLHPLMDHNVKTELYALLQQYNLANHVIIEEASVYPLPTLLSKTTVHLSKYSGALIEAGLMEVRSVILDEIGVSTFPDLIASGKAVACTDEKSSALIDLLNALVNESASGNAREIRDSNPLEQLFKMEPVTS